MTVPVGPAERVMPVTGAGEGVRRVPGPLEAVALAIPGGAGVPAELGLDVGDGANAGDVREAEAGRVVEGCVKV